MSPAPTPPSPSLRRTIGVLALQGSYAEHILILKQLTVIKSGWVVIPVRTSEELAEIDALVIPGGESTTMSLLAKRTGLLGDLRELVKKAKEGRDKKAVWGTCAGMILLSNEVVGGKEGVEGIGGVDVKVVRNQWGRQTESFESAVDLPFLRNPSTAFNAIFIRAPVMHTILSSVSDAEVEILCRIPRRVLPIIPPVINNERASVMDIHGNHIINLVEPSDTGMGTSSQFGPDADVVMARQGSILLTSFHPELATGDTRVHQWFLDEMVAGA